MIKCSDSRVNLDAFDSTPDNDVFSIRNIGNQIVTKRRVSRLWRKSAKNSLFNDCWSLGLWSYRSST
ncbi:MAG: hypothetical protein H0U78_04670 [Rickettsiaceae bacterium]|nr:hypothetical protein [Rickettsiaceae bacterium]